jgi:hypothetical protein
MLCFDMSTTFFPHIEHNPFECEQLLQKLCPGNVLLLHIRQILCCDTSEALNFCPTSALFVFSALLPDEADVPLLPTWFLAPSFHLSGTASFPTFDWQLSHTITLFFLYKTATVDYRYRNFVN